MPNKKLFDEPVMLKKADAMERDKDYLGCFYDENNPNLKRAIYKDEHNGMYYYEFEDKSMDVEQLYIDYALPSVPWVYLKPFHTLCKKDQEDICKLLGE